MLWRRSPDSNAAWPTWSAGWFADGWAHLLGSDPVLVAGIAAYRRHPSARTLADLPTIWQEGGTRLLDAGGAGPTILFVPSLVNRAHILDLDPERSMVRWLAGQGARPLLLDWGWPGAVERRFTLTDYVAGRLERAIAACGGPVVLAGYCMGGLLALAAALRRPNPILGLALLATPWDFHAEDAAGRKMAAMLPALEPALAATGAMSVDMLQTLFTLADGGGAATRYREFAAIDQDSERARLFVALEDWLNDGIPLAAPVARECLGGWYGDNTPVRGQWRIAGQPVTPESLRLPVFVALPARDRVVPPASARALAERIAHAEIHDMAAGHIGMVAGSGARDGLWAKLLAWVGTLG